MFTAFYRVIQDSEDYAIELSQGQWSHLQGIPSLPRLAWDCLVEELRDFCGGQVGFSSKYKNSLEENAGVEYQGWCVWGKQYSKNIGYEQKKVINSPKALCTSSRMLLMEPTFKNWASRVKHISLASWSELVELVIYKNISLSSLKLNDLSWTYFTFDFLSSLRKF